MAEFIIADIINQSIFPLTRFDRKIIKCQNDDSEVDNIDDRSNRGNTDSSTGQQFL